MKKEDLSEIIFVKNSRETIFCEYTECHDWNCESCCDCDDACYDTCDISVCDDSN